MDDITRGVILSDTHCGHAVGLTPPAWQWRDDPALDNTHRAKLGMVQRQLWDYFVDAYKSVNAERPVEWCVFNGDAIEGRGHFKGSYGFELVAPNLQDQADMAAWTLQNIIKAPKTIIIKGTAVHVSEAGFEYEEYIANKIGAVKCGAHEWLDINGCIIDVKHKCARSSIPHGRGTPISKERLWNALWAERDLQPKANIIVRSHVHYHEYIGNNRYLAMTTPALKGLGDRYGSRECTETVDFGFLYFDIDKNGRLVKWECKSLEIPAHKPTTIKI